MMRRLWLCGTEAWLPLSWVRVSGHTWDPASPDTSTTSSQAVWTPPSRLVSRWQCSDSGWSTISTIWWHLRELLWLPRDICWGTMVWLRSILHWILWRVLRGEVIFIQSYIINISPGGLTMGFLTTCVLSMGGTRRIWRSLLKITM